MVLTDNVDIKLTYNLFGTNPQKLKSMIIRAIKNNLKENNLYKFILIDKISPLTFTLLNLSKIQSHNFSKHVTEG